MNHPRIALVIVTSSPAVKEVISSTILVTSALNLEIDTVTSVDPNVNTYLPSLLFAASYACFSYLNFSFGVKETNLLSSPNNLSFVKSDSLAITVAVRGVYTFSIFSTEVTFLVSIKPL